MLFKWTPNFVPNKIFIFGCGGTGSRLVPLIAQFMKSCRWVVNPEIVLIDFDTVEEKNLTRQNFIPFDLSKNKAVVLANRYSKAFNINITPITAKVKRGTVQEDAALTQFHEILRMDGSRNNIFVLCVDSPEARKEILEMLVGAVGRNASNLIIDSGNENDFGQIVISSIIGIEEGKYSSIDTYNLKDSTPVSCPIPYIPMDPFYYDNMVAVSALNCAELDQTMAINTLMAANIFSIIQNIYYVKVLTFFRVNVSLQHGAIPQHMNVEYFRNISRVYTKENIIAMTIRRLDLTREFKLAQVEQAKFLQSLEPVKIVEVIEAEVTKETLAMEGIVKAKVKKAAKATLTPVGIFGELVAPVVIPVGTSIGGGTANTTAILHPTPNISTIGGLMNAVLGP